MSRYQSWLHLHSQQQRTAYRAAQSDNNKRNNVHLSHAQMITLSYLKYEVQLNHKQCIYLIDNLKINSIC